MVSSGENYAAWIQPDDETLLDRFEEAWRMRPPANLAQFVAPKEGSTPPLSGPVLEELIKIDLEYRWRHYYGHAAAAPVAVESPSPQGAVAGLMPHLARLEDYAAQYPHLELSLDLIAEEYRVRCRWGDSPPLGEYMQRFPQYTTQLPARLSRVERELQSESTHSKAAVGTHRETPDVPDDEAPPPLLAHAADSEMPTMHDLDDKARALPVPDISQPGPKAAAPPLPAKIGRYEVVRLLGEGAFGAVYLANDPQLKRQVAIKTPHARHMRNRRSRKQFLEEAQLAAQLRHPVLVAIHDIQANEEEYFLVMEYINGKSLADVLHDDWPRRRDLRYAARLIADVAEAVHEAHKQGLVHRDLKPANILIDREGNPHVTDFGLAIHEEDQRGRAWEISGTPAYMAPEQVRGESHRLDGRCDVWSLGVMFYELLTSRRAFGGRKVQDVFDEIVHREPKPPRQIDDAIPSELERVCLRCLAKDVSGRYTTARDLCDDLRRYLETDIAETSGSDFALVLSRSSFLRSASVMSASTHQSSVATALSNLPHPSGAFVGREREVAEVKHWILDEKTPVMTLLGPGGVGKTRLSQQVAQLLAQPLPGGCWWADLSAVTTAAGVANAILAAFGASTAEGEPPVDRVSSVLQYRPRLLLIMDNFEQVVEHAHATIGAWRRRAPHVQFLVTSREPLGLEGERQYELAPLAAPSPHEVLETVAEAARYSSVELFVRRAQEADARFHLNASNAADVARICAQLEGLPLAVELAAARVKILKPAQMLKKFDQKLQFLKSTRRDLSDRQRTLEGAIQWSYDHLEPWECEAFLQVSAFVAGFYLDAAESVIDLSDFPDAPPAIDVVQSLREQCLLRTLDERYELRLGMYQSIREFGEQKRRSTFSPEQEAALQTRLAECLIGHCESWSQSIHTRDGLEAIDRIALETDNLFAVQDWALAHERPDLAAQAILALAPVLAIRGPADQRLPRLQRALQGAPPLWQPRLLTEMSFACHASGDWDLAAWYADQAVSEWRTRLAGGARSDASPEEALTHAARALRQQGVMRRLRGDMEGALAAVKESEELARRAGDRHCVAAAIAQRGFVVWQQADFTEALQCYAKAETLAREIGDRADLATIARQRGHLRAQRGDYAAALADFEQAERLAKELSDRRLLHLAISARGTVYSDQGQYDQAIECFDKAERLARQLGEKRGVAVNRGNRGLVYADRGDYEKALSCYSEAESLNRELGVTSGIALNIGNRGVALAGLGRHQEALDCLREAERLHHTIGNRLQEAISRGERGAVLLSQGNVAAAQGCLSEALATFDSLDAGHTPDYFNFLVALASAQMQSGQVQAAHEAAARAQQLAGALALTAEHPRIRVRENLTLLDRLSPRA